MAEYNINSNEASNLSSAMTDYSVDGQETDAVNAAGETGWTNTKWSQQFGYYNTIAELGIAIDAKATWTIGKGFTADARTTAVLNHVSGIGIDTFNTVLENLVRDYQIGGDGFAEIILDEEGDLLNLKPLDPGSIKIIISKQGMIVRYEQVSKTPKPNKKINKNKMFHLARNRVADQIHGTSMIDRLVNIILARNEAIADYKIVLHRNVYPQIVWKLDTDDPVKIAKFKATTDAAVSDRENIYIPMGAVEREVAGVPPNSTLDPKQWIAQLNADFYQAAGVPQIIVGGSAELTEATAKIAYLAFEQTIEEEQLFIEEQVRDQLGYIINLEFPATIENELISDKKKDGPVNIQPNETTAGSGQ